MASKVAEWCCVIAVSVVFLCGAVLAALGTAIIIADNVGRLCK